MSGNPSKETGRQQALRLRRAKLERLRTAKYASGATDAQVRASLTELWTGGRQPLTVPIRSDFIALATPLLGDHADTDSALVKRAKKDAGPPLCRLVDARGVALRLQLTALFVAACARSEPHRLLNLPIAAPASGGIGWPSLVAEPTAHDASSARASTERANRERQIKMGFDKLARLNNPRLGLVELPRAGVHKGRYDALLLLRESGATSLGSAPKYARPAAAEPVVQVPAAFWLEGWVHALEDSEIAAWLMFRHLAGSDMPQEPAAMSLSGQVRWGTYVQARTVWNKHRELVSFGLMTVEAAADRRQDGTVEDYDPDAPPRRHRMWMRDGGLAAPGLDTVVAQLSQPLTNKS